MEREAKRGETLGELGGGGCEGRERMRTSRKQASQLLEVDVKP